VSEAIVSRSRRPEATEVFVLAPDECLDRRDQAAGLLFRRHDRLNPYRLRSAENGNSSERNDPPRRPVHDAPTRCR